MIEMTLETLLKELADIYENKLPFNKHIGIRVDKLDKDGAVIGIDMKDALVGNFTQNILHGGVIASVLDFTGGVIAQLHVIQSLIGEQQAELLNRLPKMSTIDMRVDYIRPGRGERFFATGDLLRLGNKVAVVRTVFHNENGVLIAAATGTYHTG